MPSVPRALPPRTPSRPRHLRQRSLSTSWANQPYSYASLPSDSDSESISSVELSPKLEAGYYYFPGTELQDLEQIRPPRARSRLLVVAAILVVISGTAILGSVIGVMRWEDTIEKVSEVKSVVLEHQPPPCNPYDQPGVLHVNLTVPSENAWLPISSPSTCQPVDYLTLLSDTGHPAPQLDFLRDRTVVLFGDSVDRDHNENFCRLVGGTREMIGDDHPLSPAYPEGEERPAPAYKSSWPGQRKWPNSPKTRPFICTVAPYNFRIVNVFHYGFGDEAEYLSVHPHYYPPATFEDRFDQIVIPLISNVAAHYNVSSTPDILSVNPGLWSLLRGSLEVDQILADLQETGIPTEEVEAVFNLNRQITMEQREWFSLRIREALLHSAKAWRRKGTASTKDVGPKILWRPLHDVKDHKSISFERLQAINEIGRSVVEELILEGKGPQIGVQGWAEWARKRTSSIGWPGKQRRGDEALASGLGTRLALDEWPSLMKGQDAHFRDQIHPLQLPGSYVWGNMILHQLKQAVEGKERSARMIIPLNSVLKSRFRMFR